MLRKLFEKSLTPQEQAFDALLRSSFLKRALGEEFRVIQEKAEKESGEGISPTEFKKAVILAVCDIYDGKGSKQRILADAAMHLEKHQFIADKILDQNFIILINKCWNQTAEKLHFSSMETFDTRLRAQLICDAYHVYAQRKVIDITADFSRVADQWRSEIQLASNNNDSRNTDREELIAKVIILAIADKYGPAAILDFADKLSTLPRSLDRNNWTHIAFAKDNTTLLDYADTIRGAQQWVDSYIYHRKTSPKKYSAEYNRRDACLGIAALGAAATVFPDAIASIGIEKDRVVQVGAVAAGGGIVIDRYLHNVTLEELDGELNNTVKMLAAVIRNRQAFDLITGNNRSESPKR